MEVTIKVKLTEERLEEQAGIITVTFDFARLKGGTGEVASNLPSGYTALEYIESTGTQYIDTGYTRKIAPKIVSNNTQSINIFRGRNFASIRLKNLELYDTVLGKRSIIRDQEISYIN